MWQLCFLTLCDWMGRSGTHPIHFSPWGAGALLNISPRVSKGQNEQIPGSAGQSFSSQYPRWVCLKEIASEVRTPILLKDYWFVTLLLLTLTFSLNGRRDQGKIRTFWGEKALKDFHPVLWGPLGYLPFTCQVLLSLLKMSPSLVFHMWLPVYSQLSWPVCMIQLHKQQLFDPFPFAAALFLFSWNNHQVILSNFSFWHNSLSQGLKRPLRYFV